MAFHQFQQSITDKNVIFSLIRYIRYSIAVINFKLCSDLSRWRGSHFLLFLGNPTFRRLFPPGTLFYLLFVILVQMILIQPKQFIFAKISSLICKCISEINVHQSICKLHGTKNASEPAH